MSCFQKERILNRALKKARWKRTLTFILSLAGRGDRRTARKLRRYRRAPGCLQLIVLYLFPLRLERALPNLARSSSPLPARERMKVRVLIQRAFFARESRFLPSLICLRTAEKPGNCGQNFLNILEHLVVPESKDPVAPRTQKQGPAFVFLRSLCMLRAVEFDDEPPFNRTEVSEVRPNRELTAKLGVAHLAVSQMMPEYPFRVSLFATQPPRILLGRYDQGHREKLLQF